MTHTKPLLALILTLSPLLLVAQSTQEEREVEYAQLVGRYFDYYEASKPDSAELMLRQALELMPEAEGNFLLRGNLAELVVARGDTLEAVELLSKALSSQPDIPELIERRGVLLSESGKPRTAMADFDKLVSIFPNNEIYRFRRVLANEQLGLWEAAEADLKVILARNEDAYLPRVKMAQIYEQQGRLLEAEKLLSYLIENDPAVAPAYRARARLLMRQDRKSEALDDVREVIRRSGDKVDPAEYLLRGEIWIMYGEEEEAKADFDRAMQAGATSDEVAAARTEVNQILESMR